MFNLISKRKVINSIKYRIILRMQWKSSHLIICDQYSKIKLFHSLVSQIPYLLTLSLLIFGSTCNRPSWVLFPQPISINQLYILSAYPIYQFLLLLTTLFISFLLHSYLSPYFLFPNFQYPVYKYILLLRFSQL